MTLLTLFGKLLLEIILDTATRLSRTSVLVSLRNRRGTVTVKSADGVFCQQRRANADVYTVNTGQSLRLCLCRQDRDWDVGLQFLPASDSKQLEKKPGCRRKLWIGLGLLVSAAALALLTGLLVWHFQCELNSKTFFIKTGLPALTEERVVQSESGNHQSVLFKNYFVYPI